jgi:hypothetical protein
MMSDSQRKAEKKEVGPVLYCRVLAALLAFFPHQTLSVGLDVSFWSPEAHHNVRIVAVSEMYQLLHASAIFFKGAVTL